jgi:hypothetical protein
MTDRLARVLAAIDKANQADPTQDGSEPAALRYGRRMSATLAQIAPHASELLEIAARAQHIERWLIPRKSYPDGRIGYLTWRKELQRHHARRTGDIMAAHGYDSADIDRVGALIRKERLKHDPEVQLLEDVICLVFLQFEAAHFIEKHEDEKVREILAKTAKKMSDTGLRAAAALELPPRLRRLFTEALASAGIS